MNNRTSIQDMEPLKAKGLLGQQIEQIQSLRNLRRDSSEFNAWRGYTARIIERIWGLNSSHLKSFREIGYFPIASTTSTPDSYFDKVFSQGLSKAEAFLQSLVKEIDELGFDSHSESLSVTISEKNLEEDKVTNISEIASFKPEIIRVADFRHKIAKIQSLMVLVSTGIAVIAEKSQEYEQLYSELERYTRHFGFENPNPFNNLNEFYGYYRMKFPSYQERRDYINNLYRTLRAR